MSERSLNRLTVLAPQKELGKVLRSRCRRNLGGRFWEWHENLRTRVVCQFETQSSPASAMQTLSRRWPKLVLILTWENQTERTMGLIKAKARKLETFQVRY
jgi:hypothetical protein